MEHSHLMDHTLLVSGGFPYHSNLKLKKEGFRYREAFLCEINMDDGQIIRQMEYVSPRDRIGEDFSMQFKFGLIYDGGFIFPTSTEILFIDNRNWEITKSLSHPTFNDLHCVAVFEGDLYVVNTGLEIVQVFTLPGELKKTINVAVTDTWERFNPKIDYRFLATTKPHQTHANYIFFLENEPWITRFEQRDAVALFDPTKRIDLGIAQSQGKPHDGLVHGDYIYFTLTDGFVVIAHRTTYKIEQIIDFNSIVSGDLQPGWCRGLAICNGLLFVGFSQLRRSKFVEYGSWIKHGKRKLPARICTVNPETATIMKEVPLSSNTGAAIFSIISTSPE